MKLTEKQSECLRIMEELPFVHMATFGENGYPAVRALLNLRCKKEYPHIATLYESEPNPLTVYLMTDRNSGKYSEIHQCKKACLYYCVERDFYGISLQGNVDIITENDLKQKVWTDKWKIYYPQGIEDYALLRFIPDRLKIHSHPVTFEHL